MAELGQTDDPRQLVPGDAGALLDIAASLRSRGDELTLAGKGLQRIDTSDGWSGAAADAFRQKFQGQPGKWIEAGDCFHSAASAIEAYAKTLTWAQSQAYEAIRQWNAGQATTSEAQTRYQQYRAAGGTDPFQDPGEATRTSAQQVLNQARQRLEADGDSAAATVGHARDKAPQKPGFWSKVGDFFSDVGAGLENAGAHALNGVASFGNAVAHHPGDVALAAAGAGLMLVSGTADAGGAVLDATGVGAIVGVPINVVSTAGVVAGGGMLAAGVGDLMMNAQGDDHVSPARTDHTGSGGTNFRDVHGGDRTAMRGVDVDHVWDNGEMYIQDDGQIVKIMDNGNGTYDVVVRDMSNPTGKPTTVIKDATDKYVRDKIDSEKWG
ncbi:putative T7SS-secreted protein [Actinoplanes sp. NPDC049681]|uniref:putative T7SS-secreted protein n=1 Tax=Actinoplanes sp. NPDC049681 TaxID=3363905 RepID=UPI0037B090C9